MEEKDKKQNKDESKDFKAEGFEDGRNNPSLPANQIKITKSRKDMIRKRKK